MIKNRHLNSVVSNDAEKKERNYSVKLKKNYKMNEFGELISVM